MTPRTRDRGSAGVEAALAVTALLAVAMFTVGALRVTNTSGDVGSAARAGARAAAGAREADARAVGEAVVRQALADRGPACGAPSVDVVRTDEIVTVTVTCPVDLDDVRLGGFAGGRTVTASATERVDPLRGGAG